MAKKKESKIDITKMPYNIETEHYLLGEILINNDIALDCISQLKKDDFFDASNRTIFESMQSLLQKNKPIDYLTVTDELRLMGKLDEVGGEEFIIDLTNGVISTTNAKDHLAMIKRDSVLRQLVHAGNDICEIGYSGMAYDAAIVESDEKLRKVSEGLEISSLEQCGQMVTDAFNEIIEAQAGNLSQRRVYTGYPLLDKVMKGMKPGSIYVLAARPGIGKSALALSIASNVAMDYGKRVAFFSLEMSGLELSKRILAQRSGITFDEMEGRAALTDFQKEKLMQTFRKVYSSELYIDSSSLNTPIQIYNKCKRLARDDKGLDLIIIDYLQLMNLDDANKNRQEIVSSLSRMIKVYARELDVPVLLLSQLNRESVKQDGSTKSTEERKPQLSDLRESGAIEQDADMVMMLHKPKGINPNDPGALIQLLIEKNRSGQNHCTINLAWYAKNTLFIEHPDQSDFKPKDNADKQEDLTPINDAVEPAQVFVQEENVKDTAFGDEPSDTEGEIPF